ncbi:NUDIX domain-containing protein [Nocardioides luteus]|uniref:NUDIX hydrolase n=1 Tax=Nocardioides luteus TaxID=1844 RepID=A0A1J4MXA7_9ACTN|nr:NUDIX hydrolase [Nocardioides luteus]OIJ23974.1 NUDIX hydrolase [Nocardioides luteus]
MSEPETTTVAEGVARIEWAAGEAVDVVRREVAAALLTHHRVEALVDPADVTEQRTATWSGLHREGLLRGVAGGQDRMLYARVASDAPVEAPEGFRALLNSFLPRKRAIGQMLVRDSEDRVLMCQLTYKKDWDLPGGIVEVGESPKLATTREIEEELALVLPAGDLLLTDWLPPWGGWDDAVCLVFDGGVHPSSILEKTTLQPREIRSVAFCTLDEVRERAADFTARRVEAALAALGGGPAYTESGRA